jgi:hypothetical protein
MEKKLKAQPKKKKPPTISAIKNKLDTQLSLYIRARDKRCVICGKTDNLQNGHYLSRKYANTRYDFQNCNCQCAGCNMMHNLNPEPYRDFMVRKYGEREIQLIRMAAASGYKMTRQDYQAIGIEIKARMEALND